VQNNPIDDIKLQSFYPIFFPNYPQQKLHKPANEFWICIPGQLEYKRRAYLELLAMLSSLPDKHIKFILLGNSRHAHGDGEDFEARLGELRDNFIVFRQFVSDTEFHQYIQQCDLIMPCLGDNPRYLQSGISGAFNLAFAYHIPMLVEPAFMAFEDFQHSAFALDKQQLPQQLHDLATHPELLANKAKAMRDYAKFSFEQQSQQYLAALN